MAETSENLDNVLRDWAKNKVKKSCGGRKQVQEAGIKIKRKTHFFYRKWLRKNT